MQLKMLSFLEPLSLAGIPFPAAAVKTGCQRLYLCLETCRLAPWQRGWGGNGAGAGMGYKELPPWHWSGKLVSGLATCLGACSPVSCFPHLLILRVVLNKPFPEKPWLLALLGQHQREGRLYEKTQSCRGVWRRGQSQRGALASSQTFHSPPDWLTIFL